MGADAFLPPVGIEPHRPRCRCRRLMAASAPSMASASAARRPAAYKPAIELELDAAIKQALRSDNIMTRPKSSDATMTYTAPLHDMIFALERSPASRDRDVARVTPTRRRTWCNRSWTRRGSSPRACSRHSIGPATSRAANSENGVVRTPPGSATPMRSSSPPVEQPPFDASIAARVCPGRWRRLSRRW